MPNFTKVFTENILLISPLIISTVICTIISIERLIALGFSYPLDQHNEFFERIRNLIMKNRAPEALALCERFKSKPVARITREGLLRAHQPQEQIKYGLQVAVVVASEKITSKTYLIAMTAGLSIVFGVLFSLILFMRCLEASRLIDPSLRLDFLTGELETSLVPLIFGLGVAAGGFLLFGFLQHQSKLLISKFRESAIRTQDILQQRYFNIESVHPDEEPTFTGNILASKTRATL